MIAALVVEVLLFVLILVFVFTVNESLTVRIYANAPGAQREIVEKFPGNSSAVARARLISAQEECVYCLLKVVKNEVFAAPDYLFEMVRCVKCTFTAHISCAIHDIFERANPFIRCPSCSLPHSVYMLAATAREKQPA